MPGGFGGDWGGIPWGGSLGTSNFSATVLETVTLSEGLVIARPVRVLSAAPVTPNIVRVFFSQPLDPLFTAQFSTTNYGINPSLVVNAVALGPGASAVTLYTQLQAAVIYQLTVNSVRDTSGDNIDPLYNTVNFAGFSIAPTFFAAAQSRTKVELVFSTPMRIDVPYESTSSYTVTDIQGNSISITAATASGPTPISRVTLDLGVSLIPGGYYVATVGPSVQTSLGISVSPNTDVFQWSEMSALAHGRLLEIPISDFSGEVSGGILGDPDGLVFFSPALDQAIADSVIEIDEITTCTQAYDVYQIPQVADPQPLYTFGGPIEATLNGAGVLWATADRLGQAIINLASTHTASLPLATDGTATGTLTETIDITKASFLNDSRWKTYPATGVTVFSTANNTAPIGPGPVSVITLHA